jgi:uncharacterized protein GlcG (DUF336 family)
MLAVQSRSVYFKYRIKEEFMHLPGQVSKGIIALVVAMVAMAAQAQTPPPYGAPISLEVAKKAASAAIAEARKNNWGMAVVVTDGGGKLVYLERLDGTQYASVDVAIAKAQAAAGYRRPTKVWEDAVAGGRNAVLGLPGAIPIEGGLPVVIEGKLVGAIGVSGGSAAQDGQVAGAGVNALKP